MQIGDGGGNVGQPQCVKARGGARNGVYIAEALCFNVRKERGCG